TTFEIYLPCAREAVPAVPAVVAPARGRQQHILVVDDEQPIVDFVSTVLRRLNYRATVFNNPQAALAFIAERPRDFHAIVTDMTMPHFTGLELINQIRALGLMIPAIIITGYSEEISMQRDLLTNISLLGKPFSGEELAQALAQILEPAA
ncbi:MAG: response regulator, partial [Steroidobacter sp.]